MARRRRDRRLSSRRDLRRLQLPVQLRAQIPAGTAGRRRRGRGAQDLVPADHVAAAPRPAPPHPRSPDSRTATGMLYSGLGPSSWPMNHSRCCANDNGTRAGRGRAPARARAARAPPAGPPARRGRRLEQHPDRHLCPQRRPEPAGQPGSQQRVPAQSEEIVVRAYPRQAENIARTPGTTAPRARPPGPPGPAHRAPGRAAPCGRASRSGVSGSAIQHHHRRGHHVLRQPRRGELPHRGRPPASLSSPSRRDHVADQPVIPGVSCRRDHRGLGHAGRRPAPPRSRPARPGTRGSYLVIGPPANTSCPSRVHTATSPVRYNRTPPRPERQATNRYASNPADPHTPAPTAHPPNTTHPPPPTAPDATAHPTQTPAC